MIDLPQTCLLSASYILILWAHGGADFIEGGASSDKKGMLTYC